MKIELPKGRRFGQAGRQRAKELHAQGLSAGKIAQELGTTYTSVRNWLQQPSSPAPHVQPQPPFEILARALVTALARLETDPTRQQLLNVLAGLYK